jgi:PAS domain S-box-containing protein
VSGLIQNLQKRFLKLFSTYFQVLVVWLVFTLMVALSYYFMRDIETSHLRRDVDDLLVLSQNRIEFEFLETEMTLNNISFNIHRMILNGAGPEAVMDYLTDGTNFILSYEKHVLDTTGAYGYFDIFGGLFLDGSGWIPPDDYDPTSRPWYKAAVAANGSIANTPLYIDMDTNEPVITYAQQILDYESRQLGIICIDILLGNIARQIVSTGITSGSYGILFDENMKLIIHPDADQIGKKLHDLKISPDIINELEQGAVSISEREIINYNNKTVIMFTQKLNNGWHIGILIPKNNYYKSLYIIAFILIILGTALAGILSFILLRIIADKQKADERAQEMLNKIEATAHWYKSILDAVPLPITVTDANTNWTFVNTQVEKFLNVKFEDIKGKPCSNWGANICNTPNCGIECAKRGLKQTYFTHNGSSYKVDVEILRDINGETAGYIEVVQDITQLEEITKRQMEAETVSKTKSAFIAVMSHEIRTPLNAILGIADIQIQDHTISQTARDALIKIHNSGDLLLRIINDILDLSKIEAGKLEIMPVDYNVPSLINDTMHINMVRINNKPIEFELFVNENTPLDLFGDELRIKQILGNLLSNAFKYTEEGIVSLSVNAEPENTDAFVMLIFDIRDTGQGMTPEEIRNLFNEFSRFHIEANRKTGGVGMGLNITRHLIRLMNGEISVKSKPGIGSTFTVRLPQKRVNSGVIGKELAENLQHFRFNNSSLLKNVQIMREYMPYGSVLIVDDVETNLYVAKGLMVPYGLKIDTVISGFEAIKKIKDGTIYDIVFMDHMMPNMDGIETTKIIREIGYVHPIVALTANAVVGQEEIYLQSGFDDFISKPIDIRQLNVVLNKLIRDKQPSEIIEKARREKAEQENSVQQQVIDSELAEIFARDAGKAVAVLDAILKSNFRKEDSLHKEVALHKEAALHKEEAQSFIINVHAMKSALANIGETKLSDTAKKLEQAGRDEKFDVIGAEMPGFLDALRAVIEKIKPKDDENETGECSEEALAFLDERLAAIREACATMNKKAAKNALNELKTNKWPRDIKEMLGKISEHLLHSEFDSAAALADEWIRSET